MTKYIFNNDRNNKQGPCDLNEADLQNLWEKVEVKIERHKTKQRQKKSLKWLIFFNFCRDDYCHYRWLLPHKIDELIFNRCETESMPSICSNASMAAATWSAF